MQSSIYLNQFNNAEQLCEPWADDVVLFQPYEAEQILLPESASCLAVKTYLKMCDLPFDVHSCSNAEFMSPGGRMTKLPFLRAGAFIVAEFEPIVMFVEQKNAHLSQWMDEDEKSDMRTYVSLVENIFSMAELYISFVNKDVYQNVTKPRIEYVFPWPLKIFQSFIKCKNSLRLLKVYQWNDMKADEVIEKVSKCCETLTIKLEASDGPFFYSNKPTELDAIVFGHLFTILTTRLPCMDLAHIVEKYKLLVEFCKNIDEKYFQKKPQ